ncbi:hypothetical protein [Natrinema ejinorense]|uniref:hypothetical protein n=1 Tax=Natrinema ejinorense TaxID=373386 RepID=UPI001B8012E3|nr:hypothetical protein [Natrinema ejinorense]
MGSNPIPTAFATNGREESSVEMDLNDTEVLREAQVLGGGSNPIPTAFKVVLEQNTTYVIPL